MVLEGKLAQIKLLQVCHLDILSLLVSVNKLNYQRLGWQSSFCITISLVEFEAHFADPQ